MNMPRALPLLVAALALGACSADPAYFLLPPPQATTRAGGSAPTLAVADIGLPAYAEANAIAALTGPGELRLDKTALWADAPRRALTRHLVAALETRLGGGVLAEPWPGFDPPALRVEVLTDRLVGAPGGAVEFVGQYVIIAPDSGRIFAADRFAIVAPVEGEGNAALIAAHGRAVEQLADRIAARIVGRRAGTS
jgi:uncharacterized protein